MTTATLTRTLADVYRERLEQADSTDRLSSALSAAESAMAPYSGETGDLRPSEITWLNQVATEAIDAAKEAAVAAIVAVYTRELPRLLPYHIVGEDNVDDTAPGQLWEQGGDAINEDALNAAGRDPMSGAVR